MIIQIYKNINASFLIAFTGLLDVLKMFSSKLVKSEMHKTTNSVKVDK